MKTSRTIKIAVFLTYGVSLQKWASAGILDRELAYFRCLAADDFKVTLITYGDESDYQYNQDLAGIELVPFYAFSRRFKWPWLRFLHSFRLPSILKKQLSENDIFRSNQLSGSWNPMLAKQKFGGFLVVRAGFEPNRPTRTRPGGLTDWGLKVIYQRIYRQADLVFQGSTADQEFVASHFGVDKDKVTVRKNWVNTKLFCPDSEEKKYQDRILTIGRLSAEKNQRRLIEALSGTDYGLDIIGSGPLENELRKLAEQLQVPVNFLGVIPNFELPDIINRYQVFGLPSDYEGNPKSLLEAMACGLGVIGTDVEGINSVIKQDKTGLLVEPQPEGLRSAIGKLMDDGDLRSRLGKAARQQIVEQNSFEELVQEEIKIYKELVENGR